MLWGAIVVAAGRGTRFGRPKQLIELAGAPMLSWSIRTFAHMPEIVDIVVVTENEWIDNVAAVATAAANGRPVRVVSGGATRQQSVRAGLDALPSRCQGVLVHDGARPLVKGSDVRNAMRVVADGHAALLGTPVVDTIKAVDSARRLVQRTLDRDTLWAAQTPQLATVRDLERAHVEAARNHVDGTDEATLLERNGVEVELVAGSPENFKITIPEDLARAEALLRLRMEHMPGEEEVLLVEIFTDENLVDTVCKEIESRGGTIDGIDRDLPTAVAVRAYVPAPQFRGFGERFEAVRNGEMTFTTRFSHFAGRTEGA
ncbi:MAG: 2-C-methyl-D-erythritol 4-phosphate cytidylyltransferase [Candidatus Eremiobacteraeota bacterium]|nr:2-C-methyl-D-erythritol 4-phosphate cytidylyltransferase [Candidatus Eremiobacteraeota bacterium]